MYRGFGCVPKSDMQTPPPEKGSPQKSGCEWCKNEAKFIFYFSSYHRKLGRFFQEKDTKMSDLGTQPMSISGNKPKNAIARSDDC